MYALWRHYLNGRELLAVVKSKHTAELLCEKWNCTMQKLTCGAEIEKRVRKECDHAG